MFAIRLNPHWERCLDPLNKQVVYATFASQLLLKKHDPQSLISHMCTGCWLGKLTSTLSYVIIAHNGEKSIYHCSSAQNVSCLEISNSSSHRFALLLCEHLLSISVVCASGPLIPQNLLCVCVCLCAHTHAGAWVSQTEKTVVLLNRQYPVDESSVKETVTQKGSDIYCSFKRSFLVCS